MATELGAHRVRCSDCRRALALLEVSGQIIASDRDAASLKEDFSRRLLACMEVPKRRWDERARHLLYYVGPLAAAAVIALAFVGVFDRSNGAQVQGMKVKNPAAHAQHTQRESAIGTPKPEDTAEAEHALDEWVDQTRKNLQDKRQSGESLQKALNLTVGQWLDILEKANDTSSPEDHFPGADATNELAEDAPDPLDSADIVD